MVTDLETTLVRRAKRATRWRVLALLLSIRWVQEQAAGGALRPGLASNYLNPAIYRIVNPGDFSSG
jgi:hypothetical protein